MRFVLSDKWHKRGYKYVGIRLAVNAVHNLIFVELIGSDEIGFDFGRLVMV
jgi:hypothetical protein